MSATRRREVPRRTFQWVTSGSPSFGPPASGLPASGLAAVLLAVTVALLLVSAPALAQAPERERRFVYGLNVFTGTEYTASFAPPAIDTVYLLAGHDNVLDPKRTEVYFWPITNEYRADFTALNEPVGGTLEVTRGGQPLATIEPTDYVVQFDPAAGLAGGRAYVGAAARERHELFLAERAAYVERLLRQSEATAEFSRLMEEHRARLAAGQQSDPPAPPPEPAPFTIYSTDVGRGFPVNLPVGEYRVRVRDDAGAVVPDSEKRLVVVAPRRQGVGYEVVSQERWTFPSQANDPADVVYTVPGGVTYLRPFAEHELDARAHARLKNPQDLAAPADRWQWVHVAPLDGLHLVVRDGERETRLGLEQFAVEQMSGAGLGYRVVPLAERAGSGRSADLTAFRVEASGGKRTMHVHLVDVEGREVAGSAREVVVLSTVPAWQLALPVLVPLAIGLSVWLWRRDQVQTARSLPPEQGRRMA